MKLIRYHDSPYTNSLRNFESLFRVPVSGISPFVGFANRVAKVAMESPQEGCSLYEDDDFFHARFDLPGVKKEELSVDMNGGVLELAVKRCGENESDREVVWKRSFTVPDGIDSGKVNAKLDDGVLTVSLSKAEAAKPRSIRID